MKQFHSSSFLEPFGFQILSNNKIFLTKIKNSVCNFIFSMPEASLIIQLVKELFLFLFCFWW